ncbi:ceramide synthase 4 isoform X1 [Felis catus]|uniref:ceramide synthase 4 isoform X1 n=2 Tax=Felis catus TaxID=9685 RepID=UPI001D1999BC|nr:ceramide synthase 4 isoform X1 [Felis catus]
MDLRKGHSCSDSSRQPLESFLGGRRLHFRGTRGHAGDSLAQPQSHSKRGSDIHTWKGGRSGRESRISLVVLGCTGGTVPQRRKAVLDTGELELMTPVSQSLDHWPPVFASVKCKILAVFRSCVRRVSRHRAKHFVCLIGRGRQDVVQLQRVVLAGEVMVTTQQLVGCPGGPRWPGLPPPPGRAGSPAPGTGPGGHALHLREPQMAFLAAQCGLTLQQTRRWFRRRRNQDRPCLSKKFCEASWRFVFYLCSFFGGLSVLYHESWLWTPVMCWDNYPDQPLKPGLYYWYLLELSFYISLLITLHLDVKRKDFKEQVAHHFVTITLIVFSYSANLLRIGSLVLLLHDASDYLLEACKIFNYTRWRKACDTLFIIFSLVFFYTRLVLFPTQILYTTYYESIASSGPFFGYYFFNGLLMMLQLLHVFWSCLILRMIYSFTKKGQMEKDVRSDVEEADSSDGDVAQESLPLKNGAAPTDGPRSRAAGRLANGHAPAT